MEEEENGDGVDAEVGVGGKKRDFDVDDGRSGIRGSGRLRRSDDDRGGDEVVAVKEVQIFKGGKDAVVCDFVVVVVPSTIPRIEDDDRFMIKASPRSLAVKIFFQPKCTAGKSDKKRRQEGEKEREEGKETSFGTDARTEKSRFRMRI